nr:hypothetical protein CFP56_39346 [Quercus suber]
MLIGSLIEVHDGLHSCLCFSLLEKLLLKAGSTPPRYLGIYRDSLAISYRNLDTSSTLGGSIEKVPASSIPSRYLVDRSRFCSLKVFPFPRYLSTPLAVEGHFLDTYLDSFLDTSRHLNCRDLLMLLYKLLSQFRFHFLDLSRPIHGCSSP